MTKRIISFDIGIKHLAYCIIDITENDESKIIDWNVIDVSREKELETTRPVVFETCGYLSENKKKTKKEKTKNGEIIIDKKTKKEKSEKENPEKPEKQEKPEKEIEYKICGKRAKYKKENQCFCETHAKKSDFFLPCKETTFSFLKKSSLKILDQIAEKYCFSWNSSDKINKTEKIDLLYSYLENKSLHKINDVSVSEKKTNQIDLIVIGRNLITYLDPMENILSSVTHVIIENQISPIANRMKTIQGMLAQYFIIKKINHIEFVSSTNKLKEYLGNSDTDYKKNKKFGIIICRKWLETPFFMNWVSFFESHPEKKDDLADSFLQGIWYIRNKLIKNADNLKINNVVLT
jgi:hypothetical protein